MSEDRKDEDGVFRTFLEAPNILRVLSNISRRYYYVKAVSS
jgi:hypothetical protein